MKNLIACFFLFLLLPLRVFSQVNPDTSVVSNDTTPLRMIKVSLNDGTKLWGILLAEDEKQLTIHEFSAGELRLDKTQIKDSETSLLEGDVLIETANGSSFFGKVRGMGAEGTLVLESQILGRVEIRTSEISRITLAGAYVMKKHGAAWFVNPNATRYFFAPSAIPLRKREGYYQNAYLLANSVNVGLTDRFTLGGGVVIPLLFYVTPKYSLRVASNFYVGGGVLFTQSFITDFNLSAGIGYGLATVGNPEHNFTLGCGYGFFKNENQYKTTSAPIVTLNGMSRISKRFSVVTENWLMPRAGYNKEVLVTSPNGDPMTEMVYVSSNYYAVAGSLGLRFMPGVKTSIDLSVVGVKADPAMKFIALPYLDVVIKFE